MLKTRIDNADKQYIKNSKEEVIYSEDGTRLLKVRATNEHIDVKPGTQAICDDAFSGNDSIHDVILPNSIEQIGKSAFKGCTSLFAIDIPAKVQIIDCSCFEGCEHLSQISLPNGLTHIERSAFYGCTSLTNITFPSTLLWIENLAFANSGIKDLYIDDNTKCGIFEQAFAYCNNLEKVVLGEQTTVKLSRNDHPSFTFANCMALKVFEAKNETTVSYESKSMLRGCMALERIVLPYSRFAHYDFNAEPDEYNIQFPVRDFNSLVIYNQVE